MHRTIFPHIFGRSNKALGDSGLKTQLWKTLLTDDRTFHLLKLLVIDFWNSEFPLHQWMTGLIRIPPKKGDLILPCNYRDIMLLEAAYKIVTILLLNRLRPIAETLDHEQQCGFRPGQRFSDAIFPVKMARRKKESTPKKLGSCFWIW